MNGLHRNFKKLKKKCWYILSATQKTLDLTVLQKSINTVLLTTNSQKQNSIYFTISATEIEKLYNSGTEHKTLYSQSTLNITNASRMYKMDIRER